MSEIYTLFDSPLIAAFMKNNRQVALAFRENGVG